MSIKNLVRNYSSRRLGNEASSLKGKHFDFYRFHLERLILAVHGKSPANFEKPNGRIIVEKLAHEVVYWLELREDKGVKEKFLVHGEKAIRSAIRRLRDNQQFQKKLAT